jgi:uncharacterized protein (DUF1501 family)
MTRILSNDRRQFIKVLGGVCAGGAAFALLPQLELVERLLASTPGQDDYRALVCVFLFGGSDSYNMLIPHEQAEYDAYLHCRGGVYHEQSNPTGLGYARDALLTIRDAEGKTWGLNPHCAGLKTLFDQGDLSFLANIGPLVQPVTRAQVLAQSVPLPGFLYSHNDQQRQWMCGTSAVNLLTGWGGRLGDRLRGLNTRLPALPPGISLSGSNGFQVGSSTLPFAVSSFGAPRAAHFTSEDAASRARLAALEEVVGLPTPSLLEDRMGLVSETALEVSAVLRAAMAEQGELETVFPTEGSLAGQLKMIAKLIRAGRSSAVGHKRQVFFASLGGFDTHQGQMKPGSHARLLGQVAEAMLAFRDAMVEIGAHREVTSFSMSDFGRTLNSNGNGTDHGWGGVQWIMGAGAQSGGTLRGGRVIGQYPVLELDGATAVGRGRQIPTLSVSQFGATLSRWAGASATDIAAIFPGLEKFDTAYVPLFD